MKFVVTLLKTPADRHPVLRASTLEEAVDVVEAALRAVVRMEEEFPGTEGQWWAISALPVTLDRYWQPHKKGRCDQNDG